MRNVHECQTLVTRADTLANVELYLNNHHDQYHFREVDGNPMAKVESCRRNQNSFKNHQKLKKEINKNDKKLSETKFPKPELPSIATSSSPLFIRNPSARMC